MEIILANIDNVVSCDILASKHSSLVQPLTNKFYCHYYCSLNFNRLSVICHLDNLYLAISLSFETILIVLSCTNVINALESWRKGTI